MKHTKAYKILTEHFTKINQLTLLDLFAANENRVSELSLSYHDLFFDFSKNNITNETLDLLIDLAKEQGLVEQIEAMFGGERINNTESRAVLHTALRASPNHSNLYHIDKAITDNIHHVLVQMQQFSNKLHNNEHLGYSGKVITDIVNIGIGGSDLGPALACHALKPYRVKTDNATQLNIHFISSVDGYQIHDCLAELDPETTLFIIASKTFTTEETMTNAKTARRWFLNRAKNETYIKQHFVAVSTNIAVVTEFGIDPNNIFQFWDFVGGRYSMWSAIGLAIILYVGYDNFSKMLDGARAMDEHFYINRNDLRHNLPVIQALIGIWYRNFFNYPTQVISPYNTRLAKLPAYIQQLEMESNGKSVNKNGEVITDYQTCPVIWGDSGINGQHAYYQLLHQGTTIHPMDIILAMSPKFSDIEHNDILLANALAQAEAFMCGKSYEMVLAGLLKTGVDEAKAKVLARHKEFLGNRPTNMFILPEISPYYLGMLVALYEHKVFTQGVIWGINSFDQMGVELGKELAKFILTEIKTAKVASNISDSSLMMHDSSTAALIQKYIACKWK